MEIKGLKPLTRTLVDSPKFDTGIIPLDLCFSGGCPRGIAVMFYAQSMVGKSMVGTQLAYKLAHEGVWLHDTEDGLQDILYAWGQPPEGIYYTSPKSTGHLFYEDFVDQLTAVAGAATAAAKAKKPPPVQHVIIDSLTSLAPNPLINNLNAKGLQARLHNELFRSFLPLFGHLGINIWVIAQDRVKLDMNPYAAKSTLTGLSDRKPALADSLTFYWHTAIEFRPGKDVTAGDLRGETTPNAGEQIGREGTFVVRKARSGGAGAFKIPVFMRPLMGLDNNHALFHFCLWANYLSVGGGGFWKLVLPGGAELTAKGRVNAIQLVNDNRDAILPHYVAQQNAFRDALRTEAYKADSIYKAKKA